MGVIDPKVTSLEDLEVEATAEEVIAAEPSTTVEDSKKDAE